MTYLMTKNRLHICHQTTVQGRNETLWTLCGLPSWYANMTHTGFVESIPMCGACKAIRAEIDKRAEIAEWDDQTVGLPLFAGNHRIDEPWLETILADVEMEVGA